MENNKRKIYVIGHKNPDTDSICSAIAYADIKNRTEENPVYEAKRAGQINEETLYVLKRFQMNTPGYMPNVGTRVKDMDVRKVGGVDSKISLKKAWTLMRNENVFTLPILNQNQELEGLITTNDITESYMDVYNNAALSEARTPYRNILETVDGTMIVGNEHAHFTDGKVLIAASSPEVMEQSVEQNDLVILGNRYEAQLCAIEMGASCIIVCMGVPISKTIRRLAEERECFVISSPHDTYTVARLINQSMPVKHFMTSENLVKFSIDDYTDDIKEVMAKLRHRDFPVLNMWEWFPDVTCWVSNADSSALWITMKFRRRLTTSKVQRFWRSSITTGSDLCRRWLRFISAISRLDVRQRFCIRFIRKKI